MNISKNAIKKLIVFLAILLFGISINGISSAASGPYEVYKEDVQVVEGADNENHYKPHIINGDWTFCVTYGEAYKATWTRDLERTYPVGYTTSTYCSYENGEVSAPWSDGTYYTMKYQMEGAVSTEDNQDVAYIIWKLGPDFDMEAQWAIWSTALNDGSHEGLQSNKTAAEAAKYKEFYEDSHEDGGDKFEEKFKIDFDPQHCGVNLKDDYHYTIGPISMEFPDGTFGEGKDQKNLFSWIEWVQMTGEDDEGNTYSWSTESGEVSLVDETGKEISDFKRNGTQSLNKKKFYAKIKTGDANIIKFGISAKAGYVESYDVDMVRYSGRKWFRDWVRESMGTDSHREYAGCTPWTNWDTGETGCSPYYNYYTGKLYRYKLVETKGEKTQDVLHVDGTAKENVKYVENDDNATPNYDVRMEIAGYVFLDQDNGKVNTGDNLRQKDEGLPDTDVWVWSVDQKGTTKLEMVLLTDKNGYYKTGKTLGPMKKYYIQFNYNGMLYDSVQYRMDAQYNSSLWEITSKAKEDNRAGFNKKFEEIGSYPSNYKIVNKMFGEALGDYNRTYLQEDIVDVFKALSKAVVETGGNLQAACAKVAGNSEEMQRKVQFAADCRMIAYTDREKISVPGADTGKVYPVWTDTPFTVDEVTRPIRFAGTVWQPIYEGQRFINFGVKARQTVDLALYKDVLKADVSINGKTETYTYDFLNDVDGKGFAVGVNESDYLNGLRGAYRNGKTYKNETQTRDIETDSYTEYTRWEEAYDAKTFDSQGNTVTKYNLSGSDKLNIAITYKISIVNQSSTTSAIKEIVDYYDNNLEFVTAYVGDEKGNKTGEVTKKEDTKYEKNSEFKSSSYKTMYLIPNNEVKLNNNEKQYIYVVLNVNGQNKAGDLLSSVLKSETDKLTVLNLAEINGYTTYEQGLIDIDSNPGNLNISKITSLTQENIMNYPNIRDMYEDDTRRAPAMVFGLYTPRTIAGTVFEDVDKNGKTDKQRFDTSGIREGNGQLDNKDKKIAGVIVELVEIKNNQLITRARTLTDSNGNYSFSGFVPGNYTIRYTYGSNNETAMTTTSKYIKGLNATSYNGQDYQSTLFTNKTDYYWYTKNDSLSDAKDDEARKNAVIAYSNSEYGVEITNHKAEVFKSYEASQPNHINEAYNKKLVEELEQKTYRYAYTPEIIIEVEYAKTQATGNQASATYTHNITGVDFGVVERPRSELVIDQDIARIKVTAADGATVLFDTDGKQTVNNLQWTHGRQNSDRYFGSAIEGKNRTQYTNGELVSVILDEELMSGAKIEITYKFTVTNNGEKDGSSKTAAKTIVNYVANNLDFDASINKGWKVVKVEDVQNNKLSTFVNNTNGENNLKLLDLSTQSTIIQTTADNALIKALAPGEQTTATLTLTKVMSTESADDLSYSNIAEIVEQANTVGRYDRGATPGNQDISTFPQEHDTTGVEGNGVSDATVIVIPPTGSKYIYYIIGITSAVILAAGVILIKKFVIDKNK